jgi:hypothetical protein
MPGREEGKIKRGVRPAIFDFGIKPFVGFGV